MRGKKIIFRPENRNLAPRILPPMDRPVTPRIEMREGSPDQSSLLRNVSLSRFPDFKESMSSPFEKIYKNLLSSQTSEDISQSLQEFFFIARDLSETTGIDSSDIAVYHSIYPILVNIVEKVPFSDLYNLILTLKCIITGYVPQKVKKTSSTSKVSKAAVLGPLKPVSPTKSSENLEHFCQFMAKLLFRVSTDQSNDAFFDNSDFVSFIVTLCSANHQIDTRVYALSCLMNASHSSSFKSYLMYENNINQLFDIFDSDVSSHKLFIQLTGLIRNLILDSHFQVTLVTKGIHHKLIELVLSQFEHKEIVYNSFRILTKLSRDDEIRNQLINMFSAKKLLSLFLLILKNHQNNPNIISRVAFVFADFSAYNEEFLIAATEEEISVELSILTDILHSETVLSHNESTAMVLQVIANLSVEGICSQVLSLDENLPQLFSKYTFASNDRTGLNLLCVTSNFTYHDNRWCPPELLAAIPKAIVSQNLPAIIESLRILCNLALVPNTILIESKIPELLVILLRHPSQDVTLYSLQTLTNLVNHAGIRRRFRNSGGVEAIKDIFRLEEMNVEELEAVAKLTMNFGALDASESMEIMKMVTDFNASQIEIVPVFIEFLKKLSQDSE